VQGLCSRHSIRHEKLESAVLEAIQKQVFLVANMAGIIEEINRSPAKKSASIRITTALESRRHELAKMAGLRTGLYVDWKNGDISHEEYHAMKREFEDKERRLKQDIANLEEERSDMENGVASGNSYFTTFLEHRNVTELSRRVITSLIKVIHIHEGGDLKITFNFADQHRRILEFIENNQQEPIVG
jgi:hypothetical protein